MDPAILEQNRALLIREVDKEGKNRQTRHGRIVRVNKEATTAVESETGSQERGTFELCRVHL